MTADRNQAVNFQKTQEGQSQWELIVHQFRKRRLAVAASFVLLFLVTISIFAPFIANDRPIRFVGFNRFEYEEALRTLRGAMGQFATARRDQKTPIAKIEELKKTIILQLDLMKVALSVEDAEKLNEFSSRLHSQMSEQDVEKASAAIKSLQTELRSGFNSKTVTLKPRVFWPVFASLGGRDISFLLANVFLLTMPLWKKLLIRFRGNSAKPGVWEYLTILLVTPVVCGFLWWALVPQRVDRTNYKDAVAITADSDKKADVVFSSTVWPPISYGLDENDLAGKTSPPAWYRKQEKSNKNENVTATPESNRQKGVHWLGTDELGRDILCRMIWGGRVSLSVGIVAVAIYVTIGIIVGAIAGYYRGICDLIISRIIEVVICFPAFFLILTIVALVGPGLFNIMIVIGLTGWTGIARLVRGEFLRLVDQEFVLAGKALGYSPMRIIFRHVLPNAIAPVLVSATFGVAGAILTESALSFLGLGITVPTPSWGGILADGRQALERAPWLIHFPGLAIFITITSYNLVGEALRDAADPRLRGSR